MKKQPGRHGMQPVTVDANSGSNKRMEPTSQTRRLILDVMGAGGMGKIR